MIDKIEEIKDFYGSYSIGSSGRVGEGAKKHEIYMAAFGGHIFYDLFVQGWRGGHGPLGTPPGSATVLGL